MKNEQLRKHLQQTLSSRWRYLQFKRKLAFCGKNVHFESNTKIFRYPENVHVLDDVIIKEGSRICACNENARISIGKNTTIGYHTFIFASESISIGNDCLIAPFVYLVDSDHSIERKYNINTQPNMTAPIFIQDDVWIGTGAKILKGVTIGEGAVIAAGSVVKDDIPPYSIYGGIPAKKIGERT